MGGGGAGRPEEQQRDQDGECPDQREEPHGAHFISPPRRRKVHRKPKAPGGNSLWSLRSSRQRSETLLLQQSDRGFGLGLCRLHLTGLARRLGFVHELGGLTGLNLLGAGKRPRSLDIVLARRLDIILARGLDVVLTR